MTLLRRVLHTLVVALEVVKHPLASVASPFPWQLLPMMLMALLTRTLLGHKSIRVLFLFGNDRSSSRGLAWGVPYNGTLHVHISLWAIGRWIPLAHKPHLCILCHVRRHLRIGSSSIRQLRGASGQSLQ